MKVIQACTSDQGYAIVKALKVNKEFRYNDLCRYLGYASRQKYSYHIRRLKNFKVIIKKQNRTSKIYVLTKLGIEAVDLIEKYLLEKFNHEEPNILCLNTDDGNHKFIQICRRCSYIKKEDKK
jgi:hypothetical protein